MATTKQEQFINDLVQFYRNRGFSTAHPSKFIARLNGKNVDLSELYARVLELGGSYKVNQFNLWDDIYFKLFQTNFIGANFAVALRQIYNRYLLQYEKSCNGNFSNDQWNEDDDDDK
ncbi:AT-rich interactive domain-containing protein 2-like protein [Euroglyphus maynei]|uniref:AT-rich interactive domain-containing protein 2-like protein n=1 Tax=Euroglyphus maynei TaxID=6958 RepID=A0A1Y3ATU9_EURMA|nr:AT-rich interactive domain-containing protein 2-like protein [Euroglyphus maynei]